MINTGKCLNLRGIETTTYPLRFDAIVSPSKPALSTLKSSSRSFNRERWWAASVSHGSSAESREMSESDILKPDALREHHDKERYAGHS